MHFKLENLKSKRAALIAAALVIGPVAMMAPATVAAQDASYSITLKDGKFSPSTLNVKAGVKFSLTITNATAKPAEFESYELVREKIVPAGGSVSVYLGPLTPGTYPYFDDFNQSSTGQIVAK